MQKEQYSFGKEQRKPHKEKDVISGSWKVKYVLGVENLIAEWENMCKGTKNKPTCGARWLQGFGGHNGRDPAPPD